jgi:two-component system, OmpR family, response regulator VicR
MRYLTTGDVARRCQVTVGTVKNWIEAGRLPAFRTPGRHFRIASDAFDRFQATFGFPADSDDRLRILVVDDQEDFADLAVETLRDLLPGAGVESASGGYEALLKIGSSQPHLLVLDLRMPALDGFEVCRRVKEAPESKATKILAMTGYADVEAESLALACGADAFVNKGEGLAALGRRVRALLEADAAPATPSARRSRVAAGRRKATRPSRRASGPRP